MLVQFKFADFDGQVKTADAEVSVNLDGLIEARGSYGHGKGADTIGHALHLYMGYRKIVEYKEVIV